MRSARARRPAAPVRRAAKTGRAGRLTVAGCCLVVLVACAPAGSPGSPAPPAQGPTSAGKPAVPTRAAGRLAGTPASQVRMYRPTTLVLPSGSVLAVDPAGVDPSGALQVPADPSHAGWWTGGAQVGEPFGSLVIAGHVDSAEYGVGALSQLLVVQIGELVVVGDAESSASYRVVARQQVPRARLAADAQAFRQDVPHRLVLITCAGRFDRATSSYADNFVVLAEPLD